MGAVPSVKDTDDTVRVYKIALNLYWYLIELDLLDNVPPYASDTKSVLLKKAAEYSAVAAADVPLE